MKLKQRHTLLLEEKIFFVKIDKRLSKHKKENNLGGI